MNTLSKAMLFGLAVGLMNVAVAEPFNDRTNWLPEATSSQPATASPDNRSMAFSGHFKEKNAWVVTVPSQGPIQCPTDQLLATHSSGFNDKYNIRC